MSICAPRASFPTSWISEPSAEEIAEQLDKPVDDVSRMLRLNERITSVDTPLGGDSRKRCWTFWPTRRTTGLKTPRKTTI